MNRPSGVRGDLYEQVLEHARREIDDASAKTEELRRTLQLLEARVEAAKSVYEAVAARLNLEDELEEEPEAQAYPETVPPQQAPEPPEESIEALPKAPPAVEVAVPPEPAEPEPVEDEGSGNGNAGFSMDLIRRHFEQKAQEAGEKAEPAVSVEAKEARGNSAFPELSEAERQLIEEHMRSRAQTERKD